MKHFFSQNKWLLFILLLTIVAYSNSFNCDYQFDDHRVILNDGIIKNFSNFIDFNFWKVVNRRPLALFTFALNYQLHGVQIFGYHAVNLGIHLMCTVLLFFLIKEVLSILNVRRSYETILYFPLILFALHPIQTQAVTYIVQRMASLSSMFYILGLVSYLQFRGSSAEKPILSKRLLWFAIVIMAFIASVLSKQTGITFPLAIALLELTVISKQKRKSGIIIGSAILTFVIAGLVYITVNNLIPTAQRDFNKQDYLLSQLHVLPYYFKLIFTASGQNIDHYFPRQNSLTAMGSVGLLIYISLWGLIALARDPIIKLGAGIFIIGMLVESSFIPINDILVEHRMHLPIIGIALIIGAFLSKLQSPKNQYILLTLSLLLTGTTIARNTDWNTKASIWLDSTQKNDNNPRAYNNYGQALMDEGLFKEATLPLKKALTIQPGYITAISNLAICYAKTGKFSLSEKYVKTLQYLAPDAELTLYASGVLYFCQDKTDKARGLFRKTLQKNNRNYLAREKLIACYGAESKEGQEQKRILLHLNSDYFIISKKKY